MHAPPRLHVRYDARPMAPSRLLALLLALLVAGCAADADDAGRGDGGSGGTGPDWPAAVPGGPLASAGADQQALEGMQVRLDGRGSLPAEDGSPLSYLWTQESGPRVALDDPNSPVAWFVAPPIRPLDGDRLVFLLSVDDGRRRARDRVVVQLVDHPTDLQPAPLAVAGADREVLAGSTVSLAPVRTLDPACLATGAAGCEETTLPFRWTQVEGPQVELLDPTTTAARFEAPPYESVLTFRLDAHRPGPDGTAGCGATDAAPPPSLCAAPDYVRIFVKPGGRLDGAPTVSLIDPEPLAPGGGVLRVGPGLSPADFARQLSIRVVAEDRDPEQSNPVPLGFRPLLGDVPLLPLALRRTLFLDPRADHVRPWARAIGVSYEAQAYRLHSAPVPVVITWEHAEGAAPPTADAGSDPCFSSPICIPFVGGDEVVLDGSHSSDPDTPADQLTYCWEQTLGPPVAFTEGADCLVGVPNRHFAAPEAPAGAALELGFVLTVSDGGPLAGLPDTAVVRVRPRDNAPPQVVLDGPAEAGERTRVRFDASRSSDADSSDRLSFSWRQIREGDVPRVTIEEAGDCAAEAGPMACVEFETPSVFADQPLLFELAVIDSRGVSSTQRFTLLVRNSENDPPAVDAGADRVAARGEAVEFTARATDPNPDDGARLTWSWQVMSGGVELEISDGPTVRFTAPEVTSDRDVVLQLEVRDPSGAVGTDQVVVSVLAEGPYASTGGDDSAAGSRLAPVATLSRALAIAGAHGFGVIHLGTGEFEAPIAPVGAVRLRGGYDAAADWSWPSDGLTRIRGTLSLGDGATLEQLVLSGGVIASGETALEATQVEASGDVAVSLAAGSLRVVNSTLVGASERDAIGLSCDGPAQLDVQGSQIVGGSGAGRHTALRLAGLCTATLDGSRLIGSVGGASTDAIGIEIGAGARLDGANLALVTGGPGSSSSTGLAVAGAARLVNAVILGGQAPNSEAVRASAPLDLHSSLLWIPPGSGPRATALALAPGASATLRNLILGAGDASDRAQIRDEGGGLPETLERVLFSSDAGCGGNAALLRSGSGVFCSASSIRALRAGWDPLVGDPAFVNAAGGDFHLGPTSPAVDAGTSTDAPPTDLEGRPRGIDGNGDGTPGPDLGPYER